MSEFRIFCIAVFVTIGLACASDNHHWMQPIKGGEAGIALLGLYVGCAVVAVFGRRSA